MGDIPSIVADIQSNGSLPQEVAEFPKETLSTEDLLYTISFAKYNNKMCGIDDLKQASGRKAFLRLKDIGMNIKSVGDFQKSGIDRISISRTGRYLNLYKGLDDGVELMEIKLRQKAGRIFYFDIEDKKTMYIVAITEHHIETSKKR